MTKATKVYDTPEFDHFTETFLQLRMMNGRLLPSYRQTTSFCSLLGKSCAKTCTCNQAYVACVHVGVLREDVCEWKPGAFVLCQDRLVVASSAGVSRSSLTSSAGPPHIKRYANG